jgi:hypothetical protein
MNEIKTQFAFFWVGADTSIPSYLVKSIRHVYKDDAFIYQVTDLTTPYIDGVNKTLRKKLPKQMMLARLKAYSLINSNKPICFLDADSLILEKIKLPEFNQFKAFLIERDDKLSVLNSQLSVAFPEFYKKKVHELMPIFFGFIVTPNGGKFFEKLQKVLLSLPQRYHEWFGDQFAIAHFWRQNKKDYFLLNQNEFLYLVSKKLNYEDLKNLKANGTKIITFKGSSSKILIAETFQELLNF